MERDVRYLFVGITVALLLAGFVGFLLWQAERYTTTDGPMYTLAVDGAVTGLGPGSPVRYLGVRKGRVIALRLSPQDSGQVQVDIELEADVPISRDTRARVQPEGITGSSFVALRTPDPEAGPPMQPDWAPHPIIRAEPSRIQELLEAAPKTLGEIDELTERAQQLLSPENIARITRALENTDEFSGRFDELADGFEELLAQGRGTLEQTNGAMAAIRGGATEIEPTLRQARAATRSLNDLARRLDQQLERNAPALNRFVDEGLPEAEALLRDLRRASAAFERLGRDLERDPAQLIHKRPEGGMEVPQ